ncbi:MAG: ABC-three component system protein [Stenotrophomonas sp.]|uniref:ABC-three component system protein n=1 Tax=Stenotrophomonas sp. TaxID=69392 RepID=UPI003D6D6137
MRRSTQFDACEYLLTHLCTRVEVRGKLNILNLHVHCEDFYAGLLNRLLELQLENMNAQAHNAEGIDLIDSNAKVIFQVSATATKGKIESTLSKDLSSYAGHGFRFMSISKDAAKLRTQKYNNPHKLTFDPANDIHDVVSLLDIILHMNLSGQREIYEYLRDELSEPDACRFMEESNLAEIINSISRQNLGAVSTGATTNEFNVEEKIGFNKLQAAAGVIEDYKICHPIVDSIYTEFDNNGVNKSRSVLDAFRGTYHKLSVKYSGDDLFYRIVDEVVESIRGASNYSPIPIDELLLCVNILAVDAFMRCKIFKNPSGTNHVAA